jgi:hypothetical protein
MKHLRFHVVAAALALAAALPGAVRAQAHTDFAGTWVLDPAQTTQGPAVPSAATYTVTQHGDTLHMVRETILNGTSANQTLVVGTDGKAWKNTLSLAGTSVAASSVVSWSGSDMTMNTATTYNGQDIVQTDVWHLGADGKTLTITRSATLGGQPYDAASSKLVFTRKS